MITSTWPWGKRATPLIISWWTRTLRGLTRNSFAQHRISLEQEQFTRDNGAVLADSGRIYLLLHMWNTHGLHLGKYTGLHDLHRVEYNLARSCVRRIWIFFMRDNQGTSHPDGYPRGCLCLRLFQHEILYCKIFCFQVDASQYWQNYFVKYLICMWYSEVIFYYIFGQEVERLKK